ncbi:hypothetical protein ACWDRX_32235, partial [Streptomyces nigra]
TGLPVRSASRQAWSYVVFVLLSWLIVVCVAVAIALSVGAVLSQEPYLRRRLGPPPESPDAPGPD